MKWRYKTVSSFTEVITGGTPSTNIKENCEDGNIPWLNTGDINKNINHEASNYIIVPQE